METSEYAQYILNSQDIITIPFAETVILLRDVSEKMGDFILPSPQTPHNSVARPILSHLFEQKHVISIWQKVAGHPFSREGIINRGNIIYANNTQTDLAFFNQTIRQQMDGTSDLKTFKFTITNRELHSLSLIGYEILPKFFWPLAAQAAWTNPEFQLHFGHLIFNFLRNSVILSANESYMPSFSPRTFWALLLLIDANPLVSQSGILNFNLRMKQLNEKGQAKTDNGAVVSASWGYEVAEILSATALEEASVSGWAGFWDQWLLAQAVAAWSPIPNNETMAFFQALIDLPILKELIPSITQAYRIKYNLQQQLVLKLDRPFIHGERPAWCYPKPVLTAPREGINNV